ASSQTTAMERTEPSEPRRRSNRTTTRRPPWVWRIIRTRPRLFISSAVGLAAIGALTALTVWKPAMRVLVGWDLGTGLYVILAIEMMARADAREIRRRAATQDEGAIVILVLTVATAVASLLAIVALLGTSATGAPQRRSIDLALAIVTIGVSWVFIHTIFALHYAHEFYEEGAVPGLAFPGGDKEPDYWDFV